MENKILDLTKELAKELQQSDLYQNYEIAKQTADKDEKLQHSIREFNELKENITKIMQNSEAPKDNLDEMNSKLKEIYDNVMNEPNMLIFNNAKDELDKLMLKINNILTSALNGEEPSEEQSCGHSENGGCEGCSCKH